MHCSDDFTYYDLNIVIVESGFKIAARNQGKSLPLFFKTYNDWCK